MNLDIFTKSFELQLMLASGYAAYFVSYVGIRHHHKTIEIAFITLAFGLITQATFNVLLIWMAPLFAGVVAFIVTVAFGLVWRAKGRPWVREYLSKKSFSWTNDDPSALMTITTSTDYFFKQIAVELHDGTWLRCDDTALFNGAPHSPFVMGHEGDIAMYLTHIDLPKSKKSQVMKSTRDDYWGDRLTYIPAKEIRRMTFRLKK
jgi:hypothetical protein